MDDVRAAAEEAQRLYRDAAPHIKERRTMRLLGVLSSVVLAEHPADDGDALDNEFFGPQWSEGTFYFSIIVEHPTPIELRIGPCEEDGTWTVALNQKPAPDAQNEPDDCVCLPSARTRGDVRRLCRALDVELKEGT